jgi:lysophospholipase L1-like esterase
VAALVLALVAASGCEPTVTREVLFIADSVTLQATPSIVSAFNQVGADADTGRYAPNFGSVILGQGLAVVPHVSTSDVKAWWSQHLDSLIERTKPDVIVVALGYNDCNNLVGYGSRIDAFMDHIPGSIPVHWLTVTDPKRRTTCDTTINNALTSAVTRNANLSLLPFATFANAHPSWISSDGVHLTPEGQQEYADWLLRRLDALYPEGS